MYRDEEMANSEKWSLQTVIFLLCRKCGADVASFGVINVPDYSINVTFVTDSANIARGFRIMFQARSKWAVCSSLPLFGVIQVYLIVSALPDEIASHLIHSRNSDKPSESLFCCLKITVLFLYKGLYDLFRSILQKTRHSPALAQESWEYHLKLNRDGLSLQIIRSVMEIIRTAHGISPWARYGIACTSSHIYPTRA